MSGLPEGLRAWAAGLERRLAPPSSALPLALLRAGVAAVILAAPEPATARAVVAGDRALWLPPEGLAWLGAVVPLTPGAVGAATVALRVAAVGAGLGLFTRASVTVLLAAFVYVFAAAQFTGTVLHDMHLAWMLCLLAFAPAGDALSLDAWIAGRPWRGGAPTRAAGIALAWARVLLGLVYFFPGCWKLLAGGAPWWRGASLQRQLWFKWFERGGAVPWPRVDRPWWLCALGAAAVVFFELSFLPFALHARGRRVALAGGVVFHLLAAHYLGIHFPSLLVCYVVLLDGGAPSPAAPREGPCPTRPRALALVGAVLAFAVVVQGVRGQTQAWPFACYPTFHGRVPAELTDLAVELVDGAGVRVLRARRDRSQQAWGTTWRLLGLYGDGIDPARLRAWGRALAARHGRGDAFARASAVRYVAERWAVDPARRFAPPVARRVLLTE